MTDAGDAFNLCDDKVLAAMISQHDAAVANGERSPFERDIEQIKATLRQRGITWQTKGPRKGSVLRSIRVMARKILARFRAMIRPPNLACPCRPGGSKSCT